MTIVKSILIILVLAALIFSLLEELKRMDEKKKLAKKNMSFIESINLTGLPIITFHNNGSPINMILDTGSNVCLINKNALKELEYSIEDSHDNIIGLSGESNNAGDVVRLPLTYKDWTFNLDCWATDLNDAISSMKKEYGVTIHGLLGTGFFTDYKYIIDFSSMVAYPKAII